MIEKTINLKGHDINYLLKSSFKSKVLRCTFSQEKGLVITKPKLLPIFIVENFLQKKSKWILNNYQKRQNKDSNLLVDSREHFLKHKEQALQFCIDKVNHWNKFYNFDFNKISVKKMTTRWGSCSSKKNLNFNYKIIFLTPQEQDYLIIHELCHLQEMNHSSAFWSLVQKQTPRLRL